MGTVRLALVASISLCACVDGFRGSNIEIDLAPTMPVQASPGKMPAMGQLPSNVHYKLYAITEGDDRDELFEVQRFEVHRIVDLDSPCFIDVGENVPFPGLHVSQYLKKMQEKTGITDLANPPAGASEQDKIDTATATQRQSNVQLLAGATGLKAVTSASEGGYPAVDANCTGSGLPPSSCIDDDSNARRLALCQAAWAADRNLFEGTDRVLTAPLNGTTFGFVIGTNPITPVPVGGAGFTVPAALEHVDEYAIYFQTDGMTAPGTLILNGRPTSPTRGVRHVHLTSPLFPNLVGGEMAVFGDLGNDDVQF
jgi:hypothetical protein